MLNIDRAKEWFAKEYPAAAKSCQVSDLVYLAMESYAAHRVEVLAAGMKKALPAELLDALVTDTKYALDPLGAFLDDLRKP